MKAPGIRGTSAPISARKRRLLEQYVAGKRSGWLERFRAFVRSCGAKLMHFGR